MKRSKKALISIISGFTMQVVAVIYGLIVPRLIIAKFGSGVNGLIASISQFLGYIVIMEAGFGPVIKAALYKPLANKNNEEIASIIKTSKRIFKRISYIFLGYLAVLCVVYPTIINTEFEFIYTFSLIIIVAVETFAEYFFGMTYRLYLQADQKSYIISLLQIVSYLSRTAHKSL